MDDMNVLVAVDFDDTLVDCNTDVYIKTLAPDGKIPKELENLSSNGWTSYMRELFKYLHEKKITPDQYYQCLSEIKLIDGMKEILLTMHESGECEIIVISDSNSIFIKHILQLNGLENVVSAIYTNSAQFDESGCLNITEYQNQDWCKRCAKNICKGWVLESHVNMKEMSNINFTKIIYIGDGVNDVCPSLKLKNNDCIFARKGFRLLKRLEKMPAKLVKGKLFSWETGSDIKNILLSMQN